MQPDGLRRTPLYDRHLAAGARIVPFAGWAMPVQYEGIIAEHRAVRTGAGVFDVSHMGQFKLQGAGTLANLQRLLSNDLEKIGPGSAQYTLLLNDAGCPVDDLIAYRLDGESALLVVNASRVDTDRAWIEQRLDAGVELHDRSAGLGMLALQGPQALGLVPLPELRPFGFSESEVCGVHALVARTGYTGEDGVELITIADHVGRLWDELVSAGATPCGLGARDTLRLEVCYPLYGSDLSEQRSALEAGLGWVCALDAKDFTGAAALRRQREAGGYDRLVAFRMQERGIPRPGMAVLPAGEVTSGTMSPCLGVGIGMAYVPAANAGAGGELTIDVRGRPHRARVAAKPLYVKETVA